METVKIIGKRLGRKRPEHPPHLDPRVLHFRDFVDTDYIAYKRRTKALPPVKPFVDWMEPAVKQLGGAGNFGMMLNAVLGCCTVSAYGHAIQIWTANTGKVVTVPDSSILTMYEASGYRPRNPKDPQSNETDQGWYIQDALQYAQKTGLEDSDGRFHKIDTFLAIDPSNLAHVDLAIEIGGLVDIGLGLPITAENQNGFWQVVPGSLESDGAPGSWGGHSIVIAKRSQTPIAWKGDPNPLVLRDGVTWGQGDWQLFPNFWTVCVDEVWLPVSYDWIEANGTAPSGFNLAGVIAAAQALHQGETA